MKSKPRYSCKEMTLRVLLFYYLEKKKEEEDGAEEKQQLLPLNCPLQMFFYVVP